jgi:hypothetical protein
VGGHGLEEDGVQALDGGGRRVPRRHDAEPERHVHLREAELGEAGHVRQRGRARRRGDRDGPRCPASTIGRAVAMVVKVSAMVPAAMSFITSAAPR